VNVNGKEVLEADLSFEKHRITFNSHLNLGASNEVTFKFQNTFVDNSAGLHKYVDPKDDKTYIYSHLEPFFCHRFFPCFD